MAARITDFTSPRVNGSGLVDFGWSAPVEAIPFELTAEVDEDPKKVRAEVWTNANHNDEPDLFSSVPMKLDRFEGKTAHFRADIPVWKVGNYRATARISTETEGGRKYSWMGDQGLKDIRFRPRDRRHDGLNIELLNVGMANFDPATGRYGTFADLLEQGSPKTNGKVTLEWLAEQGVTALWLQPIFEIEKWDGRAAVDDAGSPYATKDFFSVRRELSRAARTLEGDAARGAALGEFQAFKRRCDELGIKVLLDIAPNHVGHNYNFADLFVRYDQAGKEIREVRRNDFSQVAVNPEQLEAINERLARLEAQHLDYAEYVAPHLYGKYLDPHGAKSIEEIAAGGWFEWQDVKQLNHGRMRFGYSWWDVQKTDENTAVLGWIERVLRFWAVDMGVDGFRIDHLTGMPERFLEDTMNRVQADVDRHNPGKHLFLLGEDFHTNGATRHWLDAGQGGWFHELRRCHTAGHFESIIQSPWFHDILSLGSHDESRFIHDFGGDVQSATRMLCLLQLAGGPVCTVIGDEAGEQQDLLFKQYKGIPALRAMNETSQQMSFWKGRAGRIRRSMPALREGSRAWLRPKSGARDEDIVAIARHPLEAGQDLAFVFANMDNGRYRENTFALDEKTRRLIDPDRRYQAYNSMEEGRAAPLWDAPILGRDLIDQGIFARLRPYEIQVLRLARVTESAG